MSCNICAYEISNDRVRKITTYIQDSLVFKE